MISEYRGEHIFWRPSSRISHALLRVYWILFHFLLKGVKWLRVCLGSLITLSTWLDSLRLDVGLFHQLVERSGFNQWTVCICSTAYVLSQVEVVIFSMCSVGCPCEQEDDKNLNFAPFIVAAYSFLKCVSLWADAADFIYVYTYRPWHTLLISFICLRRDLLWSFLWNCVNCSLHYWNIYIYLLSSILVKCLWNHGAAKG